jgi:hypothetical protein
MSIDDQFKDCHLLSSLMVWRKSDEEEFTSHCVYTFQLTEQEPDRKISGITQKYYE